MPILHRLTLLQKFLILGVIAVLMSALPTGLYVRGALQEIGDARHESAGAPAIIAVNQAAQWLQVHRGLSAAMLNGDEVLGARRPAVRDAMNKALAEADRQMAAAAAPAPQPPRRRPGARWSRPWRPARCPPRRPWRSTRSWWPTCCG
ncbi:hypothetical protein [Acidovorax sp. SUPP2825]|uniref:hypothetical protein n=1 Tax=Acidovorax sp. SUPP2825 TaxID=2920879 RepID=UPI0023DE29B5|nr:hypothetical protein AVAK2825_15715 [Acidovorax sp. SUPP2825]